MHIGSILFLLMLERMLILDSVLLERRGESDGLGVFLAGVLAMLGRSGW